RPKHTQSRCETNAPSLKEVLLANETANNNAAWTNATMAPISPSSISPPSLKRPSPPQSDDDVSEEPSSKRRRIEPVLPRTPPAEEPFIPNIVKAPFFDDDPHHLLRRSIAMILKHVGFDSASKEALEA